MLISSVYRTSCRITHFKHIHGIIPNYIVLLIIVAMYSSRMYSLDCNLKPICRKKDFLQIANTCVIVHCNIYRMSPVAYCTCYMILLNDNRVDEVRTDWHTDHATRNLNTPISPLLSIFNWMFIMELYFICVRFIW